MGQGTPSSIDDYGTPALHHAVRSGSLELVKFLLQNGATPEEVDTRLLGYESKARKGAFLEYENYFGNTAFTVISVSPYAPSSRIKLLRILLAYTPMTYIFDPSNRSGPIRSSFIHGTIKDLELLIDSGTARAEYNLSPLNIIKHNSFLISNLEFFDYFAHLLPQHWALQVDEQGQGPLHQALYKCQIGLGNYLERLVRFGADVHLRDNEGYDPGDRARYYGNLIKKNASPRYQHVWPGALQAYFNALRSNGYDVELGTEDELWWPTMEYSDKTS
ncbi:MAG: hypothetical protein Q9222_005624 [Ikaeria aurantiellina]